MKNDDRTRSTPTEDDPRFKSGRWRGFWVQGPSRSRTELSLTFQDGVIGGVGHDWVGDYAIKGSYSAEDGKVFWTKTYSGSHAVVYDGVAETTNGIWGLWKITGFDKGGFQIWPDEGPADGVSRKVEVERPMDEPVREVEAERAEPALAS